MFLQRDLYIIESIFYDSFWLRIGTSYPDSHPILEPIHKAHFYNWEEFIFIQFIPSIF